MLKKHQDLLASLIIGDGYLYKGKTTYYLKVFHGEKQKDYCEWKLSIFNNSKLFKEKIKMRTRLTKLDNKEFVAYGFEKGSALFASIYKNVILNGKKSARELLKLMKSKQSLAIWFMDDGSVEYARRKNKNGEFHYYRPNIKLCTNSFTYEEHLFIQKWFKDKYKVSCRIKTEKKKNKDGSFRPDTYYLRFCSDDFEKIYKEVLSQYVHCCSSMEHKFRYAIQAFE